MVFGATKILAVVAYVAMVVVNYLAVTLPLAGRDTGAISDKYPNLFVPAGYTFSIWGLLYTLLGAYTVYQLASEKLWRRGSTNFLYERCIEHSLDQTLM